MGLGLMGMSAFYNDSDHKSDEARFKVLDAAHAAGQVLWDTADVYGDRWAPTAFLYRSLWSSLTFEYSEDLVGKWFTRTGKRVLSFLTISYHASPLTVCSLILF